MDFVINKLILIHDSEYTYSTESDINSLLTLINFIIKNEDYQMMKFLDEYLLNEIYMNKNIYGEGIDCMRNITEFYNYTTPNLYRIGILLVILKYITSSVLINIIVNILSRLCMYSETSTIIDKNRRIIPKYEKLKIGQIIFYIDNTVNNNTSTGILHDFIYIIIIKYYPDLIICSYHDNWYGIDLIKDLYYNHMQKKIKDMYPRNDKFANELKNKWHHIKYKPDNLWFNHKIKGMEPVYPIEYYE